MAGIKLVREDIGLAANAPCNKNWPLKVTAISEEPGLDSAIFVFHAADPDDPIQGDAFSNVASLQDMESIPEDNPAFVDGDLTEDFIPFYRKDTVELNFYNMNELDRAWEIIKMDARSLVREYRKSINLKPSEIYSTDE